jgi:hypothetical protein
VVDASVSGGMEIGVVGTQTKVCATSDGGCSGRWQRLQPVFLRCDPFAVVHFSIGPAFENQIRGVAWFD